MLPVRTAQVSEAAQQPVSSISKFSFVGFEVDLPRGGRGGGDRLSNCKIPKRRVLEVEDEPWLT